LLSFNKAAAPNWDALGLLGFGLLAMYFWRERFATNRPLQASMAAALLLGLVMSAVALDTDIVRSAGIALRRSDPSDRMRGWKSGTVAVEKIRDDLEQKLGERLFMISDARTRASEISFYLRDKKSEGPGHPPVYIIESQNIQNQFSFWPRYDQFVETKSVPSGARDETYTEENGVNPFVGRSALLVCDGTRTRVPHNIQAGFESVDPVAIVEVRRFGQSLRTWQVWLCRRYRTLPL
jgi:hypothetical protein